MLSELPEHLKERCRILRDESPPGQGDYVLYWMRTAMRTDENPALDTARVYANLFQVPLLVYQGLSENYRFASDRHHTFILQGARDVQREFGRVGISYAFHLERQCDRQPHLLDLAARARVVVTEDMPVEPPRRFLNSLLTRVSTPIVCVDTACVVPMQLVNRPFIRAFEYRHATQALQAERLTREWPQLQFPTREFDLSRLPWKPLQLSEESLCELVANCEIDHAVGPVVDSCGGSCVGYARWNEFRKHQLGRYARRRNDPLVDGVSRMSPYLHYGMVSPMRIAREAAQADNAGAEKYLDELLIWRELAYTFCFHRADHDQWSALPDWAQQTLQTHRDDSRETLYSWEQLARGKTADRLWNAAQKSLLMHGELHNNLRMTWGKAILNWTASPQQALQMIIDLNHRYALDGRDPASYGGILWCLGQFDRPFEPEQPIIGLVRTRPTDGHARRLDTSAYLRKVSQPRFDPVPQLAVIGAGLSGLMAARTLADHGLQVTVYEKSRGPGGRMATRLAGDDSAFDHGAQYFTARDHRFQPYLNAWIEQGLVAAWPAITGNREGRIVVLKQGRIESESNSVERWVGVPGMNAICQHLAQPLEVHYHTRVAEIKKKNGKFELRDERGQQLASVDQAIVSLPAGQARELLVEFPDLSDQLSKVIMNPCWATLATFHEHVTHEWVGAFVHDSFLTWVARNSTKPARNASIENVVLHASPAWTLEHWEKSAESVTLEMLQEFWRVSGLRPRLAQQVQAHRWKYAIPQNANGCGCYSDPSCRLVVCGDWATGGRVEGAFLSGMAAAGHILGRLEPIKSGVPEQLDLFDRF